MEFKCIIFDSDGVLVDSEALTAKVFQEMALELGFDLDFEIAVERFAGTSMKENMLFIEKNIHGSLPVDFEKEFRERTYEAFKTDLKAVNGIPFSPQFGLESSAKLNSDNPQSNGCGLFIC